MNYTLQDITLVSSTKLNTSYLVKTKTSGIELGDIVLENDGYVFQPIEDILLEPSLLCVIAEACNACYAINILMKRS